MKWPTTSIDQGSKSLRSGTGTLEDPLLHKCLLRDDSSPHQVSAGASRQANGNHEGIPDTQGAPSCDVLYVSKWYTFAACAMLQLLMGVQYCFPIYAGELKDILGYSQTQIQGIMSPLFISAVVGWLPGILYDALEPYYRLGPRATILLGLMLHSMGHSGLWMVATGRINLAYWQVVCLALVGFSGSGWVDTACLATNIRNFPWERGLVVGILKSFVGLSGSIFTTVYIGAFKPHVLNFLLFLALGPPLIGLAAVVFVNHVPPPPAETSNSARVPEDSSDSTLPGTMRKRFKAVYVIVTLLAVYQLAISAFASDNIRTIIERHMLLLGDMLFLLPLLAVPLGCRLFVRRPRAPPLGCPEKSHLSISKSSSDNSSRSVSEDNTRTRSLGADQRSAVAEICRGREGGAACDASCGGQLVSGPVFDFIGTGRKDGAVQGFTLSGNQDHAKESAKKCGLHDGGQTSSKAETEGRIKALQGHEHAAQAVSSSRHTRSSPIAIRSRNSQPSFDDYVGQTKNRSDVCVGFRHQHSSDSEGAQIVQHNEHNPANTRECNDPLPPSTRMLGDATNGETSNSQLALRTSKTNLSPKQVIKGDQPSPAANLSPLQCARTINFWLLFGVFGTGTGCGLLLINNIGQIVESLGGSADEHDVFVSLFSVMNAVGRLAFGFLPELCMYTHGTPRPLFLVLASFMMACVCGVTSLARTPSALYLSTLCGGFSYGGFWGLMPAIASEMFGLPYFASNYCFLSFSTSVSAYLLSAKLAGSLYTAAAAAHGGVTDVCMGQDCFGTTFAVAAVLAMCTTLTATVLTVRTRRLYSLPSSVAEHLAV